MLTSEPTDPGIARPDWHLVGNSSVEKIWVRFVKPAYVRSITACSLGPSRRTGHLSKACWWIVGSQAERLTADLLPLQDGGRTSIDQLIVFSFEWVNERDLCNAKQSCKSSVSRCRTPARCNLAR